MLDMLRVFNPITQFEINDQFYEDFKQTDIVLRNIVHRTMQPAAPQSQIPPKAERIDKRRKVLPQIAVFSEYCVKEHRDMFFEVNQTSKTRGSSEDTDITHVRAVMLDFDAKSGHKLPERFEVEPTYIVQTSPGSYHVYWFLRTPSTELELWCSLVKYLIALYGSDPKVINLSRVMRCPGSIHFLSGEQCNVVYGPNANYDLIDLATDFTGFQSWNIEQARIASELIIQRQKRDDASRERISSISDLEILGVVHSLKRMVCTQMAKREESKNGRNDGIIGYSRQIAKYLIHLGCDDYLQHIEDIIFLAVSETSLDINEAEIRRQMENGIEKAEQQGMQPGDIAQLEQFMSKRLDTEGAKNALGLHIAKLGFGMHPVEKVIWNWASNKKADTDGLHSHMGKFKFIEVEKADGLIKLVPAWKIWKDSPGMWVPIVGVVWEPSLGEGLIELDGKYHWNTYVDARIEPLDPTQEYLNAWKSYSETFIHPEDLDYMMSTLKYTVENPGLRPWYGLVFYSADGGTGKTSIAERVGRICGERYSKKCNLEKLDADYTDEFTSSLILRISEVAKHGEGTKPRNVVTEKLKEIIAEGDLMSNAKYGSRGMAKMHFLAIITTNNSCAVDRKALLSRHYYIRFRGVVDGGTRSDNEQHISTLFAGMSEREQDRMFLGLLNAYKPGIAITPKCSSVVSASYKSAVAADEEDERSDAAMLRYLDTHGIKSPVKLSDMEPHIRMFMAEQNFTRMTVPAMASRICSGSKIFSRKPVRFGETTQRCWVWGE